VHFSGLTVGLFGLHYSNVRAAVAHVAIGFTGHHHRHSCVIGFAPPQARYRASRIHGLYHSFTACADLLWRSASHRRAVLMLTFMHWPRSAAALLLRSSRQHPAPKHRDRRRKRCRRATLRASRWRACGRPQHPFMTLGFGKLPTIAQSDPTDFGPQADILLLSKCNPKPSLQFWRYLFFRLKSAFGNIRCC
jgi:hypothetical protein